MNVIKEVIRLRKETKIKARDEKADVHYIQTQKNLNKIGWKSYEITIDEQPIAISDLYDPENWILKEAKTNLEQNIKESIIEQITEEKGTIYTDEASSKLMKIVEKEMMESAYEATIPTIFEKREEEKNKKKAISSQIKKLLEAENE